MALNSVLAEIKRRRDRNKLELYKPYAKQREFHNVGLIARERLLMGGNQLGKTWSSAYEIAFHLTGKYPDWWQGRRWARPVVGWAGGVTGESLRDTLQRLLLGRPGEWGTGTIPGDDIIDIKRAQGIADAVDTVMVRHVSGGISRVSFKSYEKGREKWQGETIDFLALDEEPPLDIYIEGLTRTNATKGMVYMTFTPLLGMSDVVKRFLHERNSDRAIVSLTIEDVEHYSREDKDRIIASYPEHERKARAMGIPFLGSGQVYPVAEDEIAVDYFPIPAHWPRICGLDFGWDHPTAAAWLAWDRDNDIIYVYDVYSRRQATPKQHAPAIKQRGDWIPIAWPHDGLQTQKGDGETMAKKFRDCKLNMLQTHAQFEDVKSKTQAAKNSVEAGVMEILDRMKEGRFKVFRHLNDWWDEFRMYHRKDGLIVDKNDDALSATRYGVMMLRYAALPPAMKPGGKRKRAYNWRVG